MGMRGIQPLVSLAIRCLADGMRESAWRSLRELLILARSTTNELTYTLPIDIMLNHAIQWDDRVLFPIELIAELAPGLIEVETISGTYPFLRITNRGDEYVYAGSEGRGVYVNRAMATLKYKNPE